ncbi:MAG: tetratricopeptide repeat protein [Planctomycetes bacterium]|nr:tetratricopeptide repeat protein [Planctomycetota bacterium]
MSRESQSPHEAEELFADYLARLDGGESAKFDELLAAHPEHANELQALHADWRSFGSVLQKAAPGRLIDESLSPPSGASGETARPNDITSGELLRRLAESTAGSGRYRFRSLVGRGGMGVVLKVWDRELRRPLAMKVVLGKGEETATGETPPVDERALSRFLAEAQITGQLDHPGIVPVHELGTDERGRAYFTMRLVKGESFEQVIEHVHAGREGWTLVRALNVLVKVCDALAYAHSRGVVHRDIKPANVMVGKYGEAYLMDWGLARVSGSPERLDPRLATEARRSVEVKTLRKDLENEKPDSPLFTADGDIIGTPSYMSPEQARGELEQVGVRSDVYAMGALLYHLLSGRAPYIPDGGRPSPYAVWRWVLEGPPKSLDSLAPNAPSDLIAIAEKAMARDPDGRYPNAQSLAHELQAYLDGRVVAAHETGTWAETKKWVKRNKALSSALAAALLIAIGGAAAFSIKADEANEAALLARSNAARAEENATTSRLNAEAAQKARLESDENARIAKENEAAAGQREQEAKASEARAKRITEFVQKALVGSDPNQGGSRDFLVVDAMDAAVRELDQGALQDDVKLEAGLRATITEILVGNGRANEALCVAERALEILQAQQTGESIELARALHALAGAHSALGHAQVAFDLSQSALELRRRLLPPDHIDMVESLLAVGLCARAVGDERSALASCAEGLAMTRRLFSGDDAYVEAGLDNLGACLREFGRAKEALPFLEESMEMSRRLNAGDSPNTGKVIGNVASCLDVLGRSREAILLFEASLAMQRRVFQPHHPSIALTRANLANSLKAVGRTRDALDLQYEALEIERRVLPSDHPHIATSLHNISQSLIAMGRFHEALPYARSAREMNERLFAGDSKGTAICLVAEGECLRRLGREQEALAKNIAALEMHRRVHGGDHPDVISAINSLALSYQGLGDFAKALPLYEEALETSKRLADGDHPTVALAINNVAFCLHGMNRHGDALPLFETSARMYERLYEGDHPLVANGMNNVAFCEQRLGRVCEALDTYEKTLAMQKRMHSNDHPDLAISLENLANCLQATGRRDDALASFDEALQMRVRLASGDSREIAVDLMYVGRVLRELGRDLEAEGYLAGARTMAARVFPVDHPTRVKIETTR